MSSFSKYCLPVGLDDCIIDGTWYQVPGTRYLVPVPGTEYQVPGTGTRYQVSVPVSGTFKLICGVSLSLSLFLSLSLSLFAPVGVSGKILEQKS